MKAKSPKTAVVAFKVEEELAEILNKLPNKSAFIRKAIVASMSMECPLCHGSGVLPKGLHDHFEAMLPRISSRSCDSCGDKVAVPTEPGDLTADDRVRMEQFFHGGPAYCDDCYDKAPACDDCGWHIAPQQETKHRHEHSHQE
jgi:hypothetical protein